MKNGNKTFHYLLRNFGMSNLFESRKSVLCCCYFSECFDFIQFDRMRFEERATGNSLYSFNNQNSFQIFRHAVTVEKLKLNSCWAFHICLSAAPMHFTICIFVTFFQEAIFLCKFAQCFKRLSPANVHIVYILHVNDCAFKCSDIIPFLFQENTIEMR